MLRNLVVTLVIVSFSACASSKKKEDISANTVKDQTKSSHSSPAAKVATTPAPSPHKSRGRKAAAPKADAPKTEAKPEAKADAGKADKTESAPSSAGTLVCKSGGDERKIEVQAKDGGCETMYTKEGKAQSMATAQNGTSYCDGVREKIAKHLTEAGYSCK